MGKEVTLKITIVEQANSIKTIRVDEDLTVSKAIVVIKSKSEISQQAEHFLFLPEQNRMLYPEKLLSAYGLNNQEQVLEIRPKMQPIKVKLVDGTIKTMMMDVSGDPDTATKMVSEKLGIKITDEFGLQLENSEWLETGSAVIEQLRGAQLVRLRKKFFMSDGNVDKEDPQQLHLIYSECKEGIVSGSMPCTADEIVPLTALQLQIDKGDYVPGHNLDLTLYLPPQYTAKAKAWEKPVINEWKHHAKMSDINGKYRYIQLTRQLKTFGITVFKVQEKVAGQRKLADSLLGITRSSVVKMSVDKVILQDWPLRMIKRWAAGEGAFTLDFGNHSGNYYMVFTKEAERISKLLSGYIDLILKKQRDTGVVLGDDELDVADVEEFDAAATAKMLAMRSARGAKTAPTGASIHSTLQDVRQMIEHALQQYGQQGVGESSSLGKMDAPRMLAEIANALAVTMSDVLSGDKEKMGHALRELGAQIQQLQSAYQAAYAAGIGAGIQSLSGEDNLLFVCKEATDALLKLLNSEAAQRAMAGKAGDAELFNPELFYARAALAAVACSARALDANPIEAQRLLMELSKNIESAIQDMCHAAELLSLKDPAALDKAKEALTTMGEQATRVTHLLAATAGDPQAQQILAELGNAIKSAVVSLMDAARANARNPGDDEYMQRLWAAASAVSKAVEALLQGSQMHGVEASEQAMQLYAAAKEIIGQLGTLLDPDVTREQQAQALKAAHAGLGNLTAATKAIAQADPTKKDGIVRCTKQLIDALKTVEASAAKGPESAEVKNAVDGMRLAVQDILREAGYMELGKSLKTTLIGSAGKQALAQVLALHNQSLQACRGIKGDKDAQQALLNSCMLILPSIDKFLTILSAPAEKQDQELVQCVSDFIPEAADLVAAARTAVPAVTDARMKAGVTQAATSAAEAIRDLNWINHAYKAHGVTALAEEVRPMLDELRRLCDELAAESAAAASQSSPQPVAPNADQIRENAFRMLNAAARAVGNSAGRVATLPLDDVPAECDALLKASKKLAAAVRAMLGTTSDPAMHRKLLAAATSACASLAAFTEAVGRDPKRCGAQGEQVTADTQALLEAAKSIVAAEMEAKQQKSSQQVTDLAERELLGAANVIQEAMKRLTEAMQRAQQAAQTRGVSLDEAGIDGAILDAARNVVQSSAELVYTATDSQREVAAMGRAKKDSVYKRDPKWEQGLVSAAKAVAGSVQYLVKAANDHCNGETSWSALIAAAKTVAANSAQVQASTKSKLPTASAQLPKMGAAVGKVNNTTGALVKVAMARDADAGDDDDDPTATSETQLKILQMDAQVAIINLEKQIADAYVELARMRKERYEEAYAAFIRRFGDAPAPSASSSAPAASPRGAAPPVPAGRSGAPAPGRGRAAPPPVFPRRTSPPPADAPHVSPRGVAPPPPADAPHVSPRGFAPPPADAPHVSPRGFAPPPPADAPHVSPRGAAPPGPPSPRGVGAAPPTRSVLPPRPPMGGAAGAGAGERSPRGEGAPPQVSPRTVVGGAGRAGPPPSIAGRAQPPVPGGRGVPPRPPMHRPMPPPGAQ
eukprot:m51a1_g14795 hypothetical protein (1561) ;mRNA; r:518211-523600